MLLAIALGWVEVVIVLAVIVLLFGPSKLPALGQGIGRMMRGFKKEMRELDEGSELETADGQEKPHA
jgi:sec-independent protein translocase protein TatA